jgi:hypothetical protein
MSYSVAAPQLGSFERQNTQGSQTRPGLSSERCSAAWTDLQT